MKTINIIETHGSITKRESLSPVDYRILENTCVAEARFPYADYYGKVPQRISPNSLFLFTKQFYTLDEVLKITCNMKEFFGYSKKLDVATAIFDFVDHYQYAIRVKDFPDYEHIHWLQTCFTSEGINFSRKVHLLKSARVTGFKEFKIEEANEGIYLDIFNNHKGYIIVPRKINSNEFDEILINLRNNHDCPLFDAAVGSININSESKDMIRIYSENINISLLKCAKKKFTNSLLREEYLEYS